MVSRSRGVIKTYLELFSATLPRYQNQLSERIHMMAYVAGKEHDRVSTELQPPSYEEVGVQLQVAISKYLQNPSKKPLNIVAVGRGNVGNSTLINNLFDLQENDATNAMWSAKPVTKQVTVRTATLTTVPVHVYDTPGLMDEGIDEKIVMKDIRKQTQDDIFLLLCFISIKST